jgi:hypothetical protein
MAKNTRTLKAAFLLSVVAILTMAFSSFGPAFAQEGESEGESDIVPAAVQETRAGLHQETIIFGNSLDTTKGFTFKTIASRTVKVPNVTGKHLLTMDFAGASACFGVDQGFCYVRILVDGVRAKPQVSFVAFDSTNFAMPNSFEREAHAITTFSECLSSGDHTVEVQIASRGEDPSDEDPVFSVADWTFEIERMRGCK